MFWKSCYSETLGRTRVLVRAYGIDRARQGGQAVKKGDVIGYVRGTGKSTDPHLHLTILDNYDKNPNIYYLGELLDPIKICGLGTLKFGTGIGSTIVEGGVILYRINLKKPFSIKTNLYFMRFSAPTVGRTTGLYTV